MYLPRADRALLATILVTAIVAMILIIAIVQVAQILVVTARPMKRASN